MMKYIYTTVFLFFSLFAISQKTIELYPEKVYIENRGFYVLKVVDKRENKGSIGEYKNDSISEEIYIKGGVLKNFGEYFQRNCTKQNNLQIPVNIYINSVNVNEFIENKKKYASASISLTFKNNNGEYKTIISKVKEQTNNALATHEKRIREALLDCLEKYNNTIKPTDTYEVVPDEDAIEINFDDGDISDEEYKNDDVSINEYKNNNKFQETGINNIRALGFQIGGLTLVGIDYEEKLSDEIGIHAGIGVIGYTFGIKVHTEQRQNDFFFNLSWKDGGFGVINGVAFETGSKWIWNKNNNFGMIYQAGIIVFNHIDDDYVIDYLGGVKPAASLIFGIGISW